MPLVGFEPTISAGERPQTYALDRAGTGTSYSVAVDFIKGEMFDSCYLCRPKKDCDAFNC